MNEVDRQHKELIEKILTEGRSKTDRTGVGTKSIFGHQMRFNMGDGFPLITLRKIHTKSAIHEMLWFLGAFDEKYDEFGNTNIRYLLDNGVTFWSEWPYQHYMKSREYRPELPEFTLQEFESKIVLDDKFAKEFGSIGKGYGHQWIKYGSKIIETIKDGKKQVSFHPGLNQIDYLLEELRKNPDSRRLLLEAWKADEIDEILLPPCHHGFQLYTYKMEKAERIKEFEKWITENNMVIEHPMDYYDFPKRKLSLKMTQRSQDLGLGGPFNTAEYALLLHMIAQVSNMIPNELIIDVGDIHIYNNHIEPLKKLLDRSSFELPKLRLNQNIKNIYNFRFEDIEIINYKSHPNIKMEVAI